MMGTTEPQVMSDRVRLALWAAWRELNEIRARDGIPWTHLRCKASIDEEYFSRVVEELADILGEDSAPWPPKRLLEPDGSFQFGVQRAALAAKREEP